MGYGEEVNTSDFDSDIRGFDSHYPCFHADYTIFENISETLVRRRGCPGTMDIKYCPICGRKLVEN